NIMSLLKIDNKILRHLFEMRDKDFIESIEQLSICMPTILKINKKMTDCISSYTHFIKICEEFKLSLCEGRLYLFKASLHSILYNGPHSNSYPIHPGRSNSIHHGFDTSGSNNLG